MVTSSSRIRRKNDSFSVLSVLGFSVTMGHGGRPWVSDYSHGNYQAARVALKTGACFPKI